MVYMKATLDIQCEICQCKVHLSYFDGKKWSASAVISEEEFRERHKHDEHYQKLLDEWKASAEYDAQKEEDWWEDRCIEHYKIFIYTKDGRELGINNLNKLSCSEFWEDGPVEECKMASEPYVVDKVDNRPNATHLVNIGVVTTVADEFARLCKQ